MALESGRDPLLGYGIEDPDRKELERRFLRKLDKRMSILVLIYVLNYIDRNNVAAARLRGFEQDLKLEGHQYATILSIMYIGYILMQIPSNMFLDHLGKPSLHLPTCMFLWGAISISTGFVTSYYQALCARFLLGFVEAAFFPGALFLISKWYKRNELSTRMALLTCGSIISNAFGSLIASLILRMADNWGGYTAWRWLFFLEGGMTMVVALAAMQILPDFPESPSSWLSFSEQRLAQMRMIEDTGAVTKKHDGFILAVADWKVWWLAFSMMALFAALSYHVYFPTLSATMGYNRTITLLLCVPPWIFASAVALLLSRHSDNAQERFWHITFSLSMGCVGFFIAMLTMNTMVRYISLFLMAQMFAGFVCFWAWVSGSIPDSASKRAVALALINCFAQLGNVFGIYAWPSSWGPSYWKSYAFCTAMTAICIIMCYIFRRQLISLNRAAAFKGTVGGGQTFQHIL
ncbi:MFS general substrate transporter [Amanita rubescens]|nr:MFS general substrate transporter [Amanita rubescens]